MLPSILNVTSDDCLVFLIQGGLEYVIKGLRRRGSRTKIKREDVEASLGEKVGERKSILEYFFL